MTDTAADAAVAAVIGTMTPRAHCGNLFDRLRQSPNIFAELLMMAANDFVMVDSERPTCECLHTNNDPITEQTAGHWLIDTTLVKSPPSPSFRLRPTFTSGEV